VPELGATSRRKAEKAVRRVSDSQGTDAANRIPVGKISVLVKPVTKRSVRVDRDGTRLRKCESPTAGRETSEELE